MITIRLSKLQEVPNEYIFSIKAEIITFLQEQAPILVFWLSQPSYKYFKVAPKPELIEAVHTQNDVFIRSVTVT